VNREEKVAEVAELSGKFAKANIAIVADYKGLTVQDLQELRHSLRRNDAEFRVAKNTLLIRAVADTDYKGLQEDFVGTTSVTVSYGDPVSPAKILTETARCCRQKTLRHCPGFPARRSCSGRCSLS
jgi:large subunit ribosomal protein L10